MYEFVYLCNVAYSISARNKNDNYNGALRPFGLELGLGEKSEELMEDDGLRRAREGGRERNNRNLDS